MEIGGEFYVLIDVIFEVTLMWRQLAVHVRRMQTALNAAAACQPDSGWIPRRIYTGQRT